MSHQRTLRWHIVRIELGAAIGPGVVVGAILLMPPPNYMGPYTGPDPRLIGTGVAMYLIGLVWMLRIHLAEPETHRSFWRSAQSPRK